jgi:FAD/FMN-containing dehydrogenase
MPGFTPSCPIPVLASSAGGGYVNMMMDEGEDNVKAAYRDHYPRLAAIKKAVDPENLFRVNQNIKPA